MLTPVRFCFILLLLSTYLPAQPKQPWKGYSILGNGHLTTVYSDDPRVTKPSQEGIQHFYFRDYTTDYVSATSFTLQDPNGKTLDPAGTDVVGMKNFFTAQTRRPLADGSTQTVLCFVHPEDAAVLSLGVQGPASHSEYRFLAVLRKAPMLHIEGDIGLAVWPNGVALAIAGPRHSHVTLSDSSLAITGRLNGTSEVILVPGTSEREALLKARALLKKKNTLESGAREFWDGWMNAGRVPTLPAEYLEAYKRNLYCVKSANLNGQIPADITGQFVTNDMPQLYPRDAMMCARAFLMTGHPAEAKQVITFWAKRDIPEKTPGEWYARYDAHARAVDGGSGARYDEPEWDANGYYIYLVGSYHALTGIWLVNKVRLYELADFLVTHLDSNGLLYEGGIVEWTGYLPASNMICAAALKTMGKIADGFGDSDKALRYDRASKTITSALPQMFDSSRQTYADVRFTETKGANGQSLTGKEGAKVYLWDTTANVGVLWGYPDHRDLALSNAFYAKNTMGSDGGMRYFDSSDAGLAEYGHGLFFFTTAAAAEYQFLYGDPTVGKRLVAWMYGNANAYGLMPEHVNPDGLNISTASPLSWCSAEFAITLLLMSQH